MNDTPTESQKKFIKMLQTLTDSELIYHFPKLAASRDREGIIKALVFGIEKNKSKNKTDDN
jgi:hypothetical protein